MELEVKNLCYEPHGTSHTVTIEINARRSSGYIGSYEVVFTGSDGLEFEKVSHTISRKGDKKFEQDELAVIAMATRQVRQSEYVVFDVESFVDEAVLAGYQREYLSEQE